MLLALKRAAYTLPAQISLSDLSVRDLYINLVLNRKKQNRLHVGFIKNTVAKDLCHTGETEKSNLV